MQPASGNHLPHSKLPGIRLMLPLPDLAPPLHGCNPQISLPFQEPPPAPPTLYRFLPSPPPSSNTPTLQHDHFMPGASATYCLASTPDYWRTNHWESSSIGRCVPQHSARGASDAPDSRSNHHDRRAWVCSVGHMEPDRKVRESSTRKRKDGNIGCDAEFMPACKRSFRQQQEMPKKLLQLQSNGFGKEVEGRNGQETLIRFMGSGNGTASPIDHTSNWKSGRDNHGEIHGSLGRFSNLCGVHQPPDLCLELTLARNPNPKGTELPIPTAQRSSFLQYPGIGLQAFRFPHHMEGRESSKTSIEFVDYMTMNDNGLYESRPRISRGGNLNFNLNEHGGECFDQLSSDRSIPCALLPREEKIPHTMRPLVALKEGEIDKLRSEGKGTNSPLPFCGSATRQLHSASAMEKVEQVTQGLSLQGSSTGDGEREKGVLSQVQCSSVKSEVSYVNGMIATQELVTLDAARLVRASLGNTEDCYASACSRLDDVEAHINEGNGCSEDSTCRSKAVGSRKLMLPTRIPSQNQEMLKGASEGAGNTHEALDLLADVVQEAFKAPKMMMMEACTSIGEERQVSHRIGTFVHGNIPIPQRRANRHAKTTGKGEKSHVKEELAHEKLQVAELGHVACDGNGLEVIISELAHPACDGNGGMDTGEVLEATDFHKRPPKSPPALISLQGQGFIDPFIVSRRSRTRTLPSRLRDSVLEPWKKGPGKKYGAQL